MDLFSHSPHLDSQADSHERLVGAPLNAIDRRTWLELIGASMTAALAGGCDRDPVEKILPYVTSPEQMAEGGLLEFATATTNGLRTLGIVAKSYFGRPIKIEGNPAHPASLGATDAAGQALLYSLYDVDRSQSIKHLGEISSWDAFLADLRPILDEQRQKQGAGLRILTDLTSSPTLTRQFKRLRELFPKARIHRYSPAGRISDPSFTQTYFGSSLLFLPQLDQAKVIVSLDANFLAESPLGPRANHDFAAGRNPLQSERMNRLYVAESTPSITGAASDHRLALPATRIAELLLEIVRRLSPEPTLAGLAVGMSSGETAASADWSSYDKSWIEAVTRDLIAHPGKSIVLVGHNQPPAVHAAVALINEALGNWGQTLEILEVPPDESVSEEESLASLVRALEDQSVELLVMLGVNPVYDAPADLEFSKRLRSAGQRVVHHHEYEDETSRLCHWHIPRPHSLETWSDARTFDGTATILQPLISPLFGSRSTHQLLGVLLNQSDRTAYDWVRETWLDASLPSSSESSSSATDWHRAVERGIVDGTRWSPPTTQLALDDSMRRRIWSDAAFQSPPSPTPEPLWQLNFFLDPTMGDGTAANNGWLQELPKPLSKLTWENAFYVSPTSASAWNIHAGDHLEVDVGGRLLRGPALPLAGMPEGCLSLSLGYGRTAGGRLAIDRGINANSARTQATPWTASQVRVRKLTSHTPLPCTQFHFQLEGRTIARHQTYPARRIASTSGHEQQQQHTEPHRSEPYDAPPSHDPLSFYPEEPSSDRAWGMVIDMTRCTGCSACVVACQAENNVPIVGRDGVLRGREMHWLRIDSYYVESPSGVQVVHQPMLCQHCEHAPCEVVCPVAATTHSSEGLNEMTYNRCVGTRYCSNNCPYKVRRFNFFNYVEEDSPLAQLRANPDVTVRTRGVMEKCTYCVQRINAARRVASIEATQSGRPLEIPDGSVVTACQAACPSQAITFGNLRDESSQVARLRELPHHYGVLEELGTRPRTTYLARLTNPSSSLADLTSVDEVDRGGYE